jgi:hypothetical protein
VCPDDVAILTLRPQGGAFAGAATGWFAYEINGIGFTSSGQALISELGYPTLLDNGELMERTDAQGTVNRGLSRNTVIGSLMNQDGSSGGPWPVNLGVAPALSEGSSSAGAPSTMSWSASRVGHRPTNSRKSRGLRRSPPPIFKLWSMRRAPPLRPVQINSWFSVVPRRPSQYPLEKREEPVRSIRPASRTAARSPAGGGSRTGVSAEMRKAPEVRFGPPRLYLDHGTQDTHREGVARSVIGDRHSATVLVTVALVERAARAPSSERPILIRTIGLPGSAASFATSRNLSASLKPSTKPGITRVSGSSSR